MYLPYLRVFLLAHPRTKRVVTSSENNPPFGSSRKSPFESPWEGQVVFVSVGHQNIRHRFYTHETLGVQH